VPKHVGVKHLSWIVFLGAWGKPRGLIPIRRNESRKVETTAVKWLIKKGRNTGYQKHCTRRPMFDIDRLPMWRPQLVSAATYRPPTTALPGPRPPHGWVLRNHTRSDKATLGGASLDEGSACHRDLYLTAQTLTRDRHPCSRQDSNPQSQQTSGHRPTP